VGREKGCIWSLEEDETLGNLMSQVPRRTIPEIGAFLGRSRSAIYTRNCILGYTKKKGVSKLVMCDYCGDPIKRYRSWLNKHNFCDRKCWRAYKRNGDGKKKADSVRDTVGDEVVSTSGEHAYQDSVRAATSPC
jgi:hypothetical protein